MRIPAWASPLLLFILLLNSVLPPAQAREGELQFIPRLGIGRVNIESAGNFGSTRYLPGASPVNSNLPS